MNSKMYDRLKFVALIGLPALGTLYFTLAGLWGLPFADQIVGSVMAIDATLGLWVKYLSTQYEKNSPEYSGDIVVSHDPAEGKTFYLNLTEESFNRMGKDGKATFKVINP